MSSDRDIEIVDPIINDKNNIEPTFNLLKYNIGPEEIKNDAENLIQENTGNNGLLTVKTGNKWLEEAKQRPIPKMLFSEFWYEGELCILFADTNLGKSALAVQIGDSISKGKPISGFKFEAKKLAVLYCDFELSDKQFEARYSKDFTDHYVFDNNFNRAEINPEAEMPDSSSSFEEFLYDSLERAIIEKNIKVVIIDNITYLKNETERAKDALPLMKTLKALKAKHGISILALAHTPKRDSSKPITKNDLQGSKMLINFCDSAFAIGESQEDTSIRYIKQIKARNTEMIYNTDNVCLCQIEKTHNFLEFSWIRFSTEKEHLKVYNDTDKEQQEQQIIDLHKLKLSYREIGIKVGVSHMKVKRTIDKCNAL